MPSWVSAPNVRCRVCDAPLGEPYLDLGEQPLANALVTSQVEHPKYPQPELRFPLQVILCDQCGLSQLSVVVNPEILYSGYRFRSGASESWRAHCEELAKRCTKEFGDFPPKKVLDVAANDGTQLRAFSRRGWAGAGVDPSPCADDGPPIYAGFWGTEFVASLDKRWTWEFDLVIAQNVLGHVDDPIGFLRACKTVLAPEGRVVVEVPHVNSLIRQGAFDTVYHEHLSYWSYEPLDCAAEQAGLTVQDWSDMPDIHGGSTRYWLGHASATAKQIGPTAYLASEDRGNYASLAQRVEENLEQTWDLLDSCAIGFTRVLGWGASAKATVYLNTLQAHGYSQFLEAIIDDTPEKQGLLVPGVHIPIIPCPESLADVDVLWLLSWNNAPALKEKARAKGFAGKFLITHPNPRLED